MKVRIKFSIRISHIELPQVSVSLLLILNGMFILQMSLILCFFPSKSGAQIILNKCIFIKGCLNASRWVLIYSLVRKSWQSKDLKFDQVINILLIVNKKLYLFNDKKKCIGTSLNNIIN